MNLADKILEYRKKLGLSQEELSAKLGVSRQSVSKWESDQAKPEVDKLIQLSQLFGISLDELITSNPPVSRPIMAKTVSTRNLWMVITAWVLSILILMFFFVSQINGLRNQNEALVNQITNLNITLDSTVNSMQATINQLKSDLLFQNGFVADYDTSIAEANYIDEKLTYKIRILPKTPEATHGIVLSVTFADGSNSSIETSLNEDLYYTGYVTVSVANGPASITMIMSTDSGKANQIMGTLTPFEAPMIDISIPFALDQTNNVLIFKKSNSELTHDVTCVNQHDLFDGSYSIRIIRNEAVSSLFNYTWTTESQGNVCSQQELVSVIGAVTVIPISKDFSVDFKIGDRVKIEMVWLKDGKEKATPFITLTRSIDGSMDVDYNQLH